MAVSFVAAASGTVAQATTTTASPPAGAISGDLILPCLYIDEPDTVTAPVGWGAEVANAWHAGGTFAERVWAVAHSSFGSGVLSWTTRTWCDWLTLAFRGHDPARPINAIGWAIGTGTAVTAPSIRTTVDGCMLVFIGLLNEDSSATPPAGMTEWSDDGDGHYAAGAIQATAGDTGTRTATFTASFPWAALLVAIAPARQPLRRSLLLGVG
jgi:hypothetical protein